jgi:hypothetical protein
MEELSDTECFIITHVIKSAQKSTILSRFTGRLIVRFITIKSPNLPFFVDFFTNITKNRRLIGDSFNNDDKSWFREKIAN